MATAKKVATKSVKKSAPKKTAKQKVPKPIGLPEADSEDDPEEKRRRDWEYNDSIICTAYCNLLVKGQKLPSYAEMARETGLSEKSIERHLKGFNFDNFMTKFVAGNEKVMLNLFKNAATGKSEKMMRLWFECTGVLKKKIDITSGGKTLNTPLPSGVVVLDPKTLPTDVLEKLIAEHDKQNNG